MIGVRPTVRTAAFDSANGGSIPSPRTMLSQNDFQFIAQYEPVKPDPVTTAGYIQLENDRVLDERWLTVVGDFETACEEASKFIGQKLLHTSLWKYQKIDVMEELAALVRIEDHKSVIANWNEAFPNHKVKVYKIPVV